MAMSSTIMLNSFALAVRLSRTCINAKGMIAERRAAGCWQICADRTEPASDAAIEGNTGI